MLMAELAAQVKATGKTLHERLDSLYWQHGYHGEQLLNVTMTGSAGMARMKTLMQNFRTAPPASLGGVSVDAVRDYAALTTSKLSGGKPQSPTRLDAPKGDMVILDLAESGNYIAVRPSGTEPKVKFYMFTYVPAEQLANLNATKEDMKQRLTRFETELKAYADRA
jgi:phosphoglucomutase/phosphomannomutase